MFSTGIGSPGSAAGQLASPQDVAVNDSTGDVYVADTGNDRVDEFDSSGSFVRAWGWGVADGGSSFETCTNSCQAGSSSSSPGGFESPTFIAVDQSSGDVYVGDTGDDLVTKFDASGNVIPGWGTGGQLDGSAASGGPFGSLAGVAVDGGGNLWVYDQNANMFEFGSDGSVLTSWNSGRGVDPSGIAVDPSGDLYVVTGGGNVEQFSSAGSDIGDVTDDQTGYQITGLSVDSATGDLYADDGGSLIRHYTAASLATCPGSYSCSAADTFGSGNLSGSAAGMTFNPANADAYVADPASNQIEVFGPPTGPAVDSEWVGDVTTSDGQLNAQINPLGADTTYQFQYGTSSCASNPCTTVPAAPVDIGAGNTDVPVKQPISGLTPGTTYHYRIVATNSYGTTDGPDHTLTTYTPPAAQSCTNAQYRTGYSSRLPDCRAYELATPPDAEPSLNLDPVIGVPYAGASSFQASPSGDGLGWLSWLDPPDVPNNGNYFLASRSSSAGWSSVGVVPPQSTQNANICPPPMVLYSSDMSKGLLADGPPNDANTVCGQDDPALVAGEPRGYQNLFVRDNTTGSYQLVNVTPSGVTPSYANPLAVSTDLSSVVFDEAAQLTPDAPSPNGSNPTDLYEWAGGSVHLVSYLPDGTPAAGGLPASPGPWPGQAQSAATYTHAVSADGSRVVFAAGNGNLYVRENATAPQSPVSGGACTVPADACTVQVDTPQGGAGPGGGGQFLWATPDVSVIFFTDDASAGLTADTQAGSGQNLYRLDVTTGSLTDLTASSDAEVLGVSGTSADGSSVYFVADGVLASGATSGQPNLYLTTGGTTTFIATLASQTTSSDVRPADGCDWLAWCMTARVSPDGRFIAFNSRQSPTGYDNTPTDPGACTDDSGSPTPCTEIYLYDASVGTLACVSCNPSGAPPTGPTWIRQAAAPLALNSGYPSYLQRDLSDSGQVFFDSPDELVPQASNGQQNVYEFEHGQLSLLSTGTSAGPSYFVDASSDGRNVFLWTAQQLVSQDGNSAPSVYDARVNGGFPSPPTSPPPCSGDACRGALSGTPPVPTVGTVTFSGPGDVSVSSSRRTIRTTGRGARFEVRVRVPGAGRLSVSGRDVARIVRSVDHPGTYRLSIRLTRRSRGVLARRGKLRVHVEVSYRQSSGKTARGSLSLEIHVLRQHRAKRSRRTPSYKHGGAA